jgi:hypothetical protein
MDTVSQDLAGKLLALSLPVRLIPETTIESESFNKYIDNLFFQDRKEASQKRTSFFWSNFAEQRTAFLEAVKSANSIGASIERTVFLVPIFGPDETVITSARAIFENLDEILSGLECFLVFDPQIGSAIVQRHFGSLDLILT